MLDFKGVSIFALSEILKMVCTNDTDCVLFSVCVRACVCDSFFNYFIDLIHFPCKFHR